MTGEELFTALAPLVSPMLEKRLKRRDFCIFSTRIVLDVGRFFGVVVRAQPVRAIAYNREYAKHVEADTVSDAIFADGSHSVGIGFGDPVEDKWCGHLIAVADGWFGDFSIQQAERIEKGIVTGSAIVGPHRFPHWSAVDRDNGTVVEWQCIEDENYQRAPDWKKKKEKRRPLVGALIRAIRP